MSDDKLLKQIGDLMDQKLQSLENNVDQKLQSLENNVDQKLQSLENNIEDKFITNNALLLDAVDKKLQASEKRIKIDLSKEIKASQEDTIEALSDVINTGYNLHEERIQRIETTLDLPPIKQN